MSPHQRVAFLAMKPAKGRREENFEKLVMLCSTPATVMESVGISGSLRLAGALACAVAFALALGFGCLEAADDLALALGLGFGCLEAADDLALALGLGFG